MVGVFPTALDECGLLSRLDDAPEEWDLNAALPDVLTDVKGPLRVEVTWGPAIAFAVSIMVIRDGEVVTDSLAQESGVLGRYGGFNRPELRAGITGVETALSALDQWMRERSAGHPRRLEQAQGMNDASERLDPVTRDSKETPNG